jgi:hypothetical protein
MREKRITGIKKRAEMRMEEANTGMTALFFSDIFLKISYIPNKIAEIRAKISHIIVES